MASAAGAGAGAGAGAAAGWVVPVCAGAGAAAGWVVPVWSGAGAGAAAGAGAGALLSAAGFDLQPATARLRNNALSTTFDLILEVLLGRFSGSVTLPTSNETLHRLAHFSKSSGRSAERRKWSARKANHP